MPSTDENFIKLCYWCRLGDVDNVDRLISKGVNLNDIDEFNNSPLFLASLCGHEELVKLLLNRGAICDRDRHEGARCIYGALTDSIRNILLKYSISKAVDLKQPFASHLSSQLTNSGLKSHDLVLHFSDGKCIQLHRFLLAARSEYFAAKLHGAWAECSNIIMPNDMSSQAFGIIAKFIYLVPVLHSITDEDSVSLKRICEEAELTSLADYLRDTAGISDQISKSTILTSYQYRLTEEARQHMAMITKDIINLKRPANFVEGIPTRILHDMKSCSIIPDIFLLVKPYDDPDRGYIYPCHRSILVRSDYFRVMFSSQFGEASSYRHTPEGIIDRSYDLPIVSLPTSSIEVANLILSYLYFDETEVPWKLAFDVLATADALLIERLKTMAAVAITQEPTFFDLYSVFDVLTVAWQFRVRRLELYAAKVIANNIDRYAHQSEFREAILQSCSRLKDREETDTIELIDDIRFYIQDNYKVDQDELDDLDWNKRDGGKSEPRRELISYFEDHQKLENLLNEMGLNA
ncbi:LANO_0H19416g1_1 [Lachancea nothofagi CBS 11611]|uniref:LANO_0H19416g1_1 n=1 Tax=Lachancea nothofagi CBS 11611 TaxID=1266666 RepID=A0A1G4KNH6_9SACH|nr:LANO_0H19416g1_1 [Lachancea nothofagi CBS 11611]